MGTKRRSRKAKVEPTFASACALTASILDGRSRREILSASSGAGTVRDALLRLREGMRSHLFKTPTGQLSLARTVHWLDRRARADGFHVLQDWDGKTERLTEESIPVQVLDFVMEHRGAGRHEPEVLAILLDYYFFYVLALLSLRVWDEASADDHLDRLDRLLAHLQGPSGSGQRFVTGADTLAFIATSHFEPDEKAYDRLLEKVRTLPERQRRRFALVHAAILASHLRFGFEATYGRNVFELRNDNGPDYPWLCFALTTLIEAYAGMRDADLRGDERERIVEALLNGLSADPRAFVGNPPACLSAHEAERSRFRELFRRHRPALLEEFARHRPEENAYSPLSFFFNFSHNTLKAIVVDALLRGRAASLTLNDLFTGMPRGEAAHEAKRELARTLMAYARSSPDSIRGRLVPVIVYDPAAGLRFFENTIRKLAE